MDTHDAWAKSFGLPRQSRGRLSKTVGTARFNFLGADQAIEGRIRRQWGLRGSEALIRTTEFPTQTAYPEQVKVLKSRSSIKVAGRGTVSAQRAATGRQRKQRPSTLFDERRASFMV